MIKFFQAYFICWDVNLHCPKTLTPPVVQCSTLNDELGQIQVIIYIYLVHFF